MTKPVMLEREDVELIKKAIDQALVISKDNDLSIKEGDRLLHLKEQLKMELLWWNAGK